MAHQEPLPWRRGLLWLMFLGPFFFASYGFANWWAANMAQPGVVVFAWERHIPFVPWTIVPYWSIDFLYGLSFLLCFSRRQVDIHGLRLLSAQLISVACFLLFPLRFSFDRPESDGVFGWMFDVLMGFDQPFNQAPSLHISLLVVLWVRYALATRGIGRIFTHIWALLIGVSVLTTYQHHFFDVPTGILAGLFCVWLWPEQGRSPVMVWRLTTSARRCRLGELYLLGAALFMVTALGWQGWALWLLWPAVSCLLVGLFYLVIGPSGFQKQGGRLSVAALGLLAPYIGAAWLNSRWWTRGIPKAVLVDGEVWLGRLPSRHDLVAGNFRGVWDGAAELPVPRGDWTNISQPWLDLVAPEAPQLLLAAEQIESLHQDGKVLVCCALGYSRSALAVAAWLLLTRRVGTVAEAVQLLSVRRPQVVLGEQHIVLLEQFILLLPARREGSGKV